MSRKITPSTLHPVNRIENPGDLSPEFLAFFLPLHKRFTPEQQSIAEMRKMHLEDALADPFKLPEHPRPYDPIAGHIRDVHWRASVLPEWLQDQRNQMTVPADDADMVVKALNSGSPGVMVDFEDSQKNSWANLKRGIDNVAKALHGELTYEDKKRGTVVIKPSSTVVFTRPRGLHMHQWGVFPEGPVSASLFDVAQVVFNADPAKLKHPLCFYIPKTEIPNREAIWWDNVFKEMALAKKMPIDWIKCMALVESHPMAYGMDRFIFGLREHIVGLNLGRYDYWASLLHWTFNGPEWVLPDRNTIPHDVAFFQNLRKLMVETCHKRGILAIGGMTALFPDRKNAELNDRAIDVLKADKKNEAAMGMDGAWTGHPDQNPDAVAAFRAPNQLDRRYPDLDPMIDLRPKIGMDVGVRTEKGTRESVRTAIRYRHGVLNGKGASLIDGRMEDLATDRICRVEVAKRVRHGMHTEAEVAAMCDDVARENEEWREAAELTKQLILTREFDPS